MSAYQAALAGGPQYAEIGASRIKAGTVSAAVASYYKSTAFALALSRTTQRQRRGVLERFRSEDGNLLVAGLKRGHIEKMITARANTPAAAQTFIKTMRGLMAHCVAVGLRSDDPMLGIKNPRVRTPGYYTWTEDDIATFEAKHPIGSRARLALALLLFTAQRREDVIEMGRQHLRKGDLAVRQRKTGTTLVIPIHPELAAIIAASTKDNMTFLVTERGGPFSASHFTNWFGEMCREAGLYGCSAHGLRKAACRRLAEAGCSARLIMAISGHKTLAEVERYTVAADQERMARAAMARIGGDKTENRTFSVKPAAQV